MSGQRLRMLFGGLSMFPTGEDNPDIGDQSLRPWATLPFALPLSPQTPGPKSTSLNGPGPVGAYLWLRPCRKKTILDSDCWQGWTDTSTWRGWPKLKSSLSRRNTYYNTCKWQSLSYCKFIVSKGPRAGNAVVNCQHDLEFIGIRIIPFFPDLYTHVTHHISPTKESHCSKDQIQIYKGSSRSGLTYLSVLTLSTGSSLCASSHLVFFF